jgi:hypothetical protein
MAASAYWYDRTPANRERLLQQALEWVRQVVSRFTDVDGRPTYVYPCTLREQAETAAVRHLEQVTLAYRDDRLADWTEGFLDDNLADDSLAGFSVPQRIDLCFPQFLEALTCYFLLRLSYTFFHRRLAGEHLLGALRLPLTRAVRKRVPRGHNLAWTIDQALDRLVHSTDESAHRFILSWCRNPPSSLRHAINAAALALQRAVSEVISRHRDVDTAGLPAVAVPPSPAPDTGDPQQDLLGIACRAVLDMPTDKGRSVQPWLMLGGVSHRKKPPKPWKLVPGLEQPALIDALAMGGGPNWLQQQYRPRIDWLMRVHGAGAVIARLFESVHAEEPAPELPPNAGWNAFIAVGAETARQIAAGLLAQTGFSDPLFTDILSPADLQDYLRWRHANKELTRQLLVSIASRLCGRHRTATDWAAFLDSTERELSLP